MAQVENIEAAVEQKRWMGREYGTRLSRLTALQLPVEEAWAKNVYWMYGVVVDPATGMTAADFAKRLAARGIMTRPFFLGMHEQPVFLSRGWFGHEKYPVAEYIARQGLYLPSGLSLTLQQLDEVCTVVGEELTGSR